MAKKRDDMAEITAIYKEFDRWFKKNWNNEAYWKKIKFEPPKTFQKDEWDANMVMDKRLTKKKGSDNER